MAPGPPCRFEKALVPQASEVKSCFWLLCFGSAVLLMISGSFFGKRPIDDLLRLETVIFSFALNVATEIHSLTTDSGIVRSG
jgi:hypothetical protein